MPESVEVTGEAPKRFELRPVLLGQQDGDGSADPSAVLAGKRFVLLGDENEDVAREVRSRLAGHGADAVFLGPEHLLTEADGRVDGVLYLDSLADSSSPVLPHAFPVFQAALRRGPRWLLAARPADGNSPSLRSAGLHGLFRTVAREYPDTVARIVDLADTTPAAVADALLAELLAPDPAPVVLRTAAGRHGLELVETPLGTLGTTGAGPAGDGAAEAAAIGLDRDSVVLLVGGARGITATVRRRARRGLPVPYRTARPDSRADRTRGSGDRRRRGPRRAAYGTGRPRGRRSDARRDQPRSRTRPGPAGDHRNPGGTHGARQHGPLPLRGLPGAGRRAPGGQGDPRRARPARRRRLRGRSDRGPADRRQDRRVLPARVRHEDERRGDPADSAGGAARTGPRSPSCSAASRPSSATGARSTTRPPTTPWRASAPTGPPAPVTGP